MASMIDAVADPVRARLVRSLASKGPASLDELATAAGIHPNTARTHLQALTAEGFVQRETQPAGAPGRPILRPLPGGGFAKRDPPPPGPPAPPPPLSTPGGAGPAPEGGFLPMAEPLGAALGAAKPDPRALRRLGARGGRKAVGGAPA